MALESKLQEMELKSFNILPRDEILLTQRVYTDLVLMKKWKQVEYQTVPEINKCVLIGNEPGETEKLVIVPVLQQDKMSLNRLSNLFNGLNNANINQDKCTLAIYCPDSTLVYYHISKGLSKPTERN